MRRALPLALSTCHGQGNETPKRGKVIDLSVVIPTHNRKEILRRSLKALLDQTLPHESYEIVIVDDGSTDETENMVRRMVPTSPVRIRYYYQSNKGPAAARNLGAFAC